jgi:hypothetical protein
MATKIKICGLKTHAALEAALAGGADYVGLVFFPRSPRHLPPGGHKNTDGSADRVVHLVNLRSGVHRGWLTAEVDAGYETTRIGCRQLGSRMGQILEAVRTGTTFEVVDHQTGAIRCYLTWCPPRAIAEADVPSLLTYQVKRRQGRLTRMLREEFPSAVATQAVSVP